MTGAGDHSTIPEVGSLVTARVLTIHSQMIKVSIIAVGETVLHTAFRGMVKKINVREHLVDKVAEDSLLTCLTLIFYPTYIFYYEGIQEPCQLLLLLLRGLRMICHFSIG